MRTFRIIEGDSLEALKAMPDASVDACVTDPPYDLTAVSRKGSPRAQGTGPFGRHRLETKGFMGKAWDGTGIAFNSELWFEVLRVLKPGGHLLSFGGTRTYHRMACAIEDAGFEIRDCIQWLYGSGFPKSLDVSKALDRRKDWKALPLFQEKVKEARRALGISQSEAARRIGLIPSGESLGGGGFMWFETGMRIPTPEQYARLKVALNMNGDCDAAFEAAEREVVGRHPEGSTPGGFGDHRFTFNTQDITAPATEEAQKWQGWGTALKPANEPIVVARKPLCGTVAANIQKFGTGALNIEVCRIDIEPSDDIYAKNPHTVNQASNQIYGAFAAGE